MRLHLQRQKQRQRQDGVIQNFAQFTMSSCLLSSIVCKNPASQADGCIAIKSAFQNPAPCARPAHQSHFTLHFAQNKSVEEYIPKDYFPNDVIPNVYL